MRNHRKFIHNLSDIEIADLFQREMEYHGLIFDGKDLPLQMDGRKHYVRVAGRKRLKANHRSGWYIGRFGDFPSGSFGWLHGENPTFKWSLYQHLKNNGQELNYKKVSEEDLAKEKLEKERQAKIRERLAKEHHSFAKAYSIIEFSRSLPLTQHPYLIQKHISLNECNSDVRIYNQNNYTVNEVRAILKQYYPEYLNERNLRKLMDYQEEYIQYRGFNLLLAGRTILDEMLMFQLIFDKKSKSGKNKHFPKDLIKQDSFFLFGAALTEETEIVIICEGWATGLSIARFTRWRVSILVAWDSGNMCNVAITIRKKFRKCRIYSANDNDHTSPPSKNTGLLSGLKTCHAVGAYMIPPPFDSNDPKQADWSDWNDIDLNYPFDIAQQMFIKTFKSSKLIHASYVENTKLLTENERFNDFDYLTTNIKEIDFKEFNKNWAIFINLIHQGLMHCRYTEKEQLELYVQEKALYESECTINEQYELTNHLEMLNFNLELSKVFLKFNSDLLLSNKNLLMADDVFIPLIKYLYTKQKNININLLSILKQQLIKHTDAELADALFAMYLKKSKIFRENKEWRAIFTKNIRDWANNREIDPGLFYCLVIQQSELNYWNYNTQEEREKIALSEFIHIYEENLIFFIKKTTSCVDIHYNALPPVYDSIFKVISSCEDLKQLNLVDVKLSLNKYTSL